MALKENIAQQLLSNEAAILEISQACGKKFTSIHAYLSKPQRRATKTLRDYKVVEIITRYAGTDDIFESK